MTKEEFHEMVEEAKKKLAGMTEEELADLEENGCNACQENDDDN